MEHDEIIKKIANADNIVKKHSVFLSGHATSVTLEDIYWKALKQIAKSQNRSLSQLITEVDNNRAIPLSSALRIYVLSYYLD
ncbi:MAG: ribbon-helix-helix domain-containing protein [Alphaproteobacteria bacterium]